MNPVLFIPGPTQVDPEVLAEMSRPAIGHRSAECARLWKTSRDGLRTLMQTENEIVMLTGPASAMMEATVRNLVSGRSLHLVNGAFSRRWFSSSSSRVVGGRSCAEAVAVAHARVSRSRRRRTMEIGGAGNAD